MIDLTQVITSTELADMFHISRSTSRRWCDMGLHYRKPARGCRCPLLIDETDLVRFFTTFPKQSLGGLSTKTRQRMAAYVQLSATFEAN